MYRNSNKCNSTNLLTERPQVYLAGERVAARLLVSLTLLKVKVKSQEGDGEEGWQLAQLSRLESNLNTLSAQLEQKRVSTLLCPAIL